MSIASEISRIQTNIANTYTALGEKGATMPAVLNSDNLADTVATVTSGGGGGSGGNAYFYNQSEFENYISILNNIIPDAYGDTISMRLSELANAGYLDSFTNFSGSDYLREDCYFLVCQFHSNIKKVYFPGYNMNVRAYICPSDITITYASGYWKSTIEFTGESRTIVFCVTNQPLYGLHTYFSPQKQETNFSGACVAVYVKKWSSQNILINGSNRNTSMLMDFYDYGVGRLCFLCKVFLPSNIKFSFPEQRIVNQGSPSGATIDQYTSNFSYFVSTFANAEGDDFLKNHSVDALDEDGFLMEYPQVTYTYSGSSSTVDTGQNLHWNFGSTVSSISSSYEYQDINSMCAFAGLTKVPFLQDLSQITSSGDWYFFRVKSAWTVSKITQARIILPSTVSVFLCSRNPFTDSSVKPGVPLDLKSYQFMAEHAPTISSGTKTLYVGNLTYGKMQIDPDWIQVFDAFQAKNWTIYA